MADASKKDTILFDECDMVGVLQPASMTRNESNLFKCAKTDDYETAKDLLKKHTNPNKADNFNRTPLHVTCMEGSGKVMKLLLAARANIDEQDRYGMTPLLWATWYGYTDLALALITKHDASCDVLNKRHMNILHCAGRNNQAEIFQSAVPKIQKEQPYQIDQDGREPLSYACESGCLIAVRALFGNKKVPLSRQDKTGLSPVHYASKAGSTDIMRLLLTQGAQRDYTGAPVTPLHLASIEGHLDVVKMLLGYKVNVNAPTEKEQRTALHLASLGGYTDIVEYLLGHDANPNLSDRKGNSSLHLAVKNNRVEVVKVLVYKGAHVNMQNQQGMTPLYVAAEKELEAMVELLLLEGANVKLCDQSGRSPMYVAMRSDNTNIVDIIIKADRYKKSASPKLPEQKKPISTKEEPEENGLEFQQQLTFTGDMHPYANEMKRVIWKTAYKYMKKPSDWTNLATKWNFSQSQIEAIQYYTSDNPKIYQDHAYRMMNIWIHGVPTDVPPLQTLLDSLVELGKHRLAKDIREGELKRTQLGSKKESKCLIV